MSEVAELFNELLFGSGAWLGLLVILSIIILVSEISKMARILFIPLSVFMGFMYLQNIPANSDFMWAGILMFLTSIFLIVRLAMKK